MCRTTIPRSRNNSSDVKFWSQVTSKGVSVVSTVSSRGIRPKSQPSCPLDYNLFAKKKWLLKAPSASALLPLVAGKVQDRRRTT